MPPTISNGPALTPNVTAAAEILTVPVSEAEPKYILWPSAALVLNAILPVRFSVIPAAADIVLSVPALNVIAVAVVVVVVDRKVPFKFVLVALSVPPLST